MSTLLTLKAPIPSAVVKVSDSEGFVVRGLSPYQVVALYKRHTGELEPLFQRVVAGVKDSGEALHGDIEAIVLSLAAEAPRILAELIALASGGDPDNPADAVITDPVSGEALTLKAFDAAALLAMHLPFPTQTDALAKIGELTFSSDMPPGKFFALVASLAKKVTGAMQTLVSPEP